VTRATDPEEDDMATEMTTQTDECDCLPGRVCEPCTGRGYQNGLAGYAARIYPDRVTDADVEEQERADREAELG
jgi:hypothetical protein